MVDRPGGIFVRHAEQIANEDRVLFESVARVIITDSRGTLSEQISRRLPTEVRIPRLAIRMVQFGPRWRLPRWETALGPGKLTAMINPVNHARTPEGAALYKVEPYVVAADVYALEPHTGRGGWTWYTGSAGWMYRLIVESLLGLRLEIDRLHFAPCLPAQWRGYTLHYRYRATVYHIAVARTESPEELDAIKVTVDGVAHEGKYVLLVDDLKEHQVEVRFNT